MKKIAIAWIACVLGLVAVLGLLGTHMITPATNARHDSALITSGFTLQDAKGTVTDTQFRGRYMLVFFGFTHCPDVCPTTLLLMQNAIHNLGEVGKQIQPIFITVDPERDTPVTTSDYASHFGPGMLGLSGTPVQIKEAADHFKVYYSKMPSGDSPSDYMMDHSSFIYLMGPDGEYVTHFPADIPQQSLKDGLARYVH